jgi:hypothetical protein
MCNELLGNDEKASRKDISFGQASCFRFFLNIESLMYLESFAAFLNVRLVSQEIDVQTI